MNEELERGTVLLGGRYEILACVGTGGSASVYRARRDDNQEVAIKVLLPARAQQPDEVRRLEQEFDFGTRLHDIDGVAPAFEHGRIPELDGRPYITFPLLGGEELDYTLTAGPLPPATATSALAKLARVVSSVHAAGVLHRDIKPSNVMVSPSGAVTLLDFGHARQLGPKDETQPTSRLTRAHELVGTRHYMSPEQALGEDPTPSWDIYALGMTLFESLVGDCPFSDLSARESLQRRCIPGAEPFSIRDRKPSLPGPLIDFVDRCLAYDPRPRPQTALAFAEELEALTLGPCEEDQKPAPSVPTKIQRPRSGMQSGRYSIIRQIGDGGCAIVYLAEDTQTGTHVALKVLIERYKGRPEREVFLEQEAKALERIGPHPNIVGLFDHGRLPGSDWPFVALELIQGKSIEDLVFDNPVSARRATDIAMQVAIALRECHRAGVVHRDLTPSNVLLDTARKRAVLIDFSHCAWADGPKVPVGHPDRRTRHGEVAGTSQAMSPEQARAEPADPAMDVYAFGVLLFQLLTARAPFPEYMERDIFIALQSRNHLETPELAPADLPDAPAALVTLLNSCIQPSASQRPAMAAIIRTLEALLASMAMVPPPMTQVLEAPALLPEAAPPPEDTPAPAAAHSSVLPYTVLSIGLLLLVVSLIALVIPSTGNSRREPGQLSSAPPATQAAALALSADAPSEPKTPAQLTQLPAEPPPAEPPPAQHEPTSPKQPAPVTSPRPSTPRPEADTHAPAPTPPPGRPRDCSGNAGRARAATKRQQWSTVLRATKAPSCWSDQQERRELRLTALRSTGKYEACVELATKLGDHRTEKFCSRRLAP